MIFSRDPLANPEPLIRRVYAYVAYCVGDGPDAEDITSDTFERAIRYRSSFSRKKGEPIAWLIGIARRAIADHQNRRLELGEVVDAPAPGDLASEVAARADLHRAVATLDARKRELIALRYGADLTAKQIAELLDVRTNAIEVALHRALGKLRKELEEPSGSPAALRADPDPSSAG
jgi:RNA polymerase sigma-70 factor (ECF subfamily)